jgi:hypothetical protein
VSRDRSFYSLLTKLKLLHRTSSSEKLSSSSVKGSVSHILRLQVADTGAGISAENQKKLFGQYVQFNASKLQKGEGSGLGLWISKGIVEMHGGRIGAYSDGEGKGSVFYVDLPLFMEGKFNPVNNSDQDHDGDIDHNNNHGHGNQDNDGRNMIAANDRKHDGDEDEGGSPRSNLQSKPAAAAAAAPLSTAAIDEHRRHHHKNPPPPSSSSISSYMGETAAAATAAIRRGMLLPFARTGSSLGSSHSQSQSVPLVRVSVRGSTRPSPLAAASAPSSMSPSASTSPTTVHRYRWAGGLSSLFFYMRQQQKRPRRKREKEDTSSFRQSARFFREANISVHPSVPDYDSRMPIIVRTSVHLPIESPRGSSGPNTHVRIPPPPSGGSGVGSNPGYMSGRSSPRAVTVTGMGAGMGGSRSDAFSAFGGGAAGRRGRDDDRIHRIRTDGGYYEDLEGNLRCS